MRQRWRERTTAMILLLFLTPVNGQNRGLNEIDFSSVGGVAGASSSHDTVVYSPINAFLGRCWADAWKAPPQKIWYRFPNPISVTKFSFQGRSDLPLEWSTHSPTEYQFFGSNFADQCDDENYWTVLFEDRSGTPFASVDDIKVEEICNPRKYICYGFKVLATLSPEGVRMENIRFYTRTPVNYSQKKLFRVPYTDVLAPTRRGAANCPTHDTFVCDRTDDYLEIYSEKSLADAQIDSRFTIKRKSCQCKCLCLDDPLCQAVTIITPQSIMEGHRCLFSSNNAVLDGTTLQTELSAISYIKRGCDQVNCTMNSICEDDNGTKAAVCGCEDPYKSNGLECAGSPEI